MTKVILSLLISSVFATASAQDNKFSLAADASLTDLQTEAEILSADEAIFDSFGDIDFSHLEEGHSFTASDLDSYSYVDPQGVVPRTLLTKALNFYKSYKSRFKNQRYMTVVDFSASSAKARFFVIDMSSGTVTAIRTAHGRYSDNNNDGYVESVGNVNGSGKSSKGFYQVSEIYRGKYGRSIRMDGLSSTNSNVRRRAIVIHGADYVREKNVKQGRSLGCFALAWSVKDKIVDKIAGGSLLYADFSK